MPPKRFFRESGASSGDASTRGQETGASRPHDVFRAQVHELSTQEGREDHGAGSSQSQPYHEIFNQRLKDAGIDYCIEDPMLSFNRRCNIPQKELGGFKNDLEKTIVNIHKEKRTKMHI